MMGGSLPESLVKDLEKSGAGDSKGGQLAQQQNSKEEDQVLMAVLA